MVKNQDPSKYERIKFKKPRKQLTMEQKEAAAERLAKAREKKKKKLSSLICQKVLELPDDDPLSLKNVKEWLSHQLGVLKAERKHMRSDVKGAEARAIRTQNYIKNIYYYLRTGEWVDDYCGKTADRKMKTVCIALAYDAEGNPKRSVGTWYPDIGGEWTLEMDREERARGKHHQLKRKAEEEKRIREKYNRR